MLPRSRLSLWDLVAPQEASPTRFLADPADRLALRDLAGTSLFGERRETLRGRSVMISTERQFIAALMLIELDGIASRLVICTPDLSPDHVKAAIADAEVEVVVSDGGGPAAGLDVSVETIVGGGQMHDIAGCAARDVETEWALFTSGTTGRPKIVLHSLAGLTGPQKDKGTARGDVVWSTFYDIRRYGGLQIFLRAMAGGGSLVLSDAHETPGAFLARAGANGVKQISGTPSHWRRALMSGALASLKPDYVRLSGETADQTILDALQRSFPDVPVVHAFASTEAGVGFEVRDGVAGFPVSVLDSQAGVEMRVLDGSLRIRSSRTATRYVGANAALTDAEGFVDTGDLLERRGDRYYFAGRREGVINVGGAKVHPETVEAVINRHPAVSMSRVSARKSPITGA
ncbi:MAG TPA: AMP-binding protein, partial [Acetobacteraceae bacterium]|nr:AMP-binding protein [Acetobacteraceae bacterium]